MRLKRIFWLLFKKEYYCSKCGSPSNGFMLCNDCRMYVLLLEEKKKKEIMAKEDLNRRSWIKSRNDFMEEYNG